MLPRRCQHSWLGWQLHANGGGDLAGAGMEVAQRAPLARALLGARQGPRRGVLLSPARILPGVLWLPSARILPGVLWLPLARILPRIVVF